MNDNLKVLQLVWKAREKKVNKSSKVFKVPHKTDFSGEINVLLSARQRRTDVNSTC